MRLRNIPGAKEAVMESAFVVQRPQEKKEAGHRFIHRLGRYISRLAWEKDNF